MKIILLEDIRLSKNFMASEFVDPSNNELIINMELVDKLQLFRDTINEAIFIASGYRSIVYNKLIGGADGSQHTKATATDIKSRKTTPFEMLQIAEQIGFGGIGLYNTWLHVDIRLGHSRWFKKSHEFSPEIMEFIKKLNYKPY